MTNKEYVSDRMTGAKSQGLSTFNWSFPPYYRIFRKQVKEVRYKGVFIGFEGDGYLFTSGEDMLFATKLKVKKNKNRHANSL